jgi:hypothetical protein
MPYVMIDSEFLNPPCNCLLVVRTYRFRVFRILKLAKRESCFKISPARYNVSIFLL